MSLLSTLRISLWQKALKKKRETRSGAMALVAVLLFFIFSTLGLSMLYLSQIYLKTNALKKNSTLLHYASENGIKLAVDALLSQLSSAAVLSIISDEERIELLENTKLGGTKMLERILGSEPPFQASQDWENLEWETRTSFELTEIFETESFFHLTYRVEIVSEGKIKNIERTKESSFEAQIGIFAGRIPLSYLPFLLDKKLDAEQKEGSKGDQKIILLPGERNLFPPQVSIAGAGLIPENASALVQKALKIKFFYPQNLPNSVLRPSLGLEKSNDPVPDGVYLIKDDLGLGGIFVQGNLEEMTMSLDEGFQVVSFRTDEGRWILRFNPAAQKTFFSTPEETQQYNLLPRGMIVVNGEIRSLGGGTEDSSGQFSLSHEEIPSILSGVNLTIISSDRITLSSHLIHQGVMWMKGVPYVKDSNSELIIFSSGKDFIENTEREGKIVISADSPQEIKIQASLAAGGEGFFIEGEGKIVHILGSLQASDYSAQGSCLRIKFNEKILDRLEENSLLMDAPETAAFVLFLSFFRPVEWKEN